MFCEDSPLAINNGSKASSTSKWSTMLKVATSLSSSCKATWAVPTPPHNSRTLSPSGNISRSRLRRFHVVSALHWTNLLAPRLCLDISGDQVACWFTYLARYKNYSLSKRFRARAAVFPHITTVHTRLTTHVFRYVHAASIRAFVSHLFFTSASVFRVPRFAGVAIHAFLQADLLRRGRQTNYCATTSREVLARID